MTCLIPKARMPSSGVDAPAASGRGSAVSDLLDGDERHVLQHTNRTGLRAARDGRWTIATVITGSRAGPTPSLTSNSRAAHNSLHW
jgi:hypothetical protein